MRPSVTGQPSALSRRNQFQAGFARPARANTAHTSNSHGQGVGSVLRARASANIDPNLTRMKRLKRTTFVPDLTRHVGAQKRMRPKLFRVMGRIRSNSPPPKSAQLEAYVLILTLGMARLGYCGNVRRIWRKAGAERRMAPMHDHQSQTRGKMGSYSNRLVTPIPQAGIRIAPKAGWA
jgi:hypothetical protein